ncbi:hypothetical protein PV328_001328 [Microctonus aethiopoides]|uniref:DNA polymerase delta subunit 3 n=1 Tax=Microctonus aethiopoides TaxID=144406 RepID=A0AA39FXB4_9HYME|nr:hypothetical protein PV328_001328 [Microctonus aethiopoides]
MDVYMKTLDGFINDEDKFVTYKWLSNELELHVNVAKQILEEYWNNHKKDGIVATIIIIGYLKNGEMRVELVKDSNLTDTINKYDKIISQHVYSLQKSLSDIQLLAGMDKCNPKYSTIFCEKSVLFTDEELFSRRWGNTDMAIHAQPEPRKPPVDRANDTKKSNGIGKFFKEPVGNKKVPSNEDVQNKEEDKSDDKKISPPKNKTSPKKGTNSKKPVQSQKMGFSNLFGKVSTANQKKSPPLNVVNNKIDKKDSSMEIEAESINENINNMNNSIEKPTMEQKIESNSKDEKCLSNETPTDITKNSITIPNDESKSNKSKKTKRGAKRERSREPKVDSKKRKRILVVADSSEESAASDEEMFCDSPPHEEIAEVKKSPSPPPVQNINGKRKVRKLVDKTFMDDDGYLVTKKEHVYESCSDDDANDEPKKIPEQKKIVEPPVKTIKKQTTLTNFFKKA